MYQPQWPMPSLRRLMIFIDGENMVFRYQKMLEDGNVRAQSTVQHERDVFVWQPNTWVAPIHAVLRAVYYTYVQGDETKVRDTHEKIRKMAFQQYRPVNQNHIMAGVNNTLYSKVYQKIKGKKAKCVDMQMNIDILSNVYQDNPDTVYLLSGDGDYQPVVEECVRRGKQVCLGAFSSGLNTGLRLAADHFVCLDGYYFEPPLPVELHQE